MKRKLGEICRIVSGSTPKTDIPEYWDGDLKWVTPAELNDESRVVNNTKRTITELGATKTGLTPLPAGTVLLSSRAPIGKVAITGCEMYCNQGFKNLICSDSINNKYLYWFLKGKTQYLNSLGRGATFKEISKTIVADIEINLPDIEEQKKIVNRIEKIDSRLTILRAEISRLDELIKARFVEMFGDGFETTELRNICKTTSGGTPSTKNPDYYNGTIPWVTTTALGPNHIDGTKAKAYISEEAVANSATKIIPSGSILFGIRVGVGKTSINDVDICTNQDIVAIMDVNEAKFSKLFIKHVLDANRAHYDSLKKGATILGITSDDLKNTPIPLAPIKAQKDFETFVEQVDKSKFALSNELAMGDFYIRLVHDCIMHGRIDL